MASAQIGFYTEAKNALDEMLSFEHRTLDKKYGGSTKPFPIALRTLSREVLDRLRIPATEIPPIRFIDQVNQVLTSFWT